MVRIVSLMMFCVLLGGCGTISKVQPSTEGQAADLSRYSRVVVAPFDDKVSNKANNPDVQARRRIGVGRFRELLASEIRASGSFAQVATEGSTASGPDTLLIGGAITRYVEGSSFTRLMVGLGAGNAYFDATVEFRDASTGKLLGTVLVDRNSWGGGGLISMSQTLDSFMTEAVKTVAAQLVAAKTTGHFTPPKPAPAQQRSRK